MSPATIRSHWAGSAGPISSPAKPLGLEVPMRRQDGRSVSKLTYQRRLARRKRPRPLRSTFHATSPDAIDYVVLLQPGASWRIDENQSPFFDAGHDQYSFYRDRCMRDLCRRHAGPHVDIDVPVLYVAIVLMSTRLFEGRGILIVSVGCAVLTVAGYLLSLGTCR